VSKVRVHISVSADGYVAGPNQSLENPLGEGGEALHEWVVALRAWREPHGMEGGEVNASTPVVEEMTANVGAEIMGRGKFGGGPGPWDGAWRGWWGDDPPFRMPVFVVTHHEREPLTLSDTTFTFVSDGIESALDQARRAAAGKDVLIGGGASVINQYLAAGLVDEVELNVVPLVLGGGARLFDGVGPELRRWLGARGSDRGGRAHGQTRRGHSVPQASRVAYAEDDCLLPARNARVRTGDRRQRG
jgi:dihydrofolate reductase